MNPELALMLAFVWAAVCLAGFVIAVAYAIRASRR